MDSDQPVPSPSQAAATTDVASPVITLNVGGCIFTALRSTLTNQSKYFRTLLSEHWRNNANYVDGHLFVDADPDGFKHLLNYLRTSYPPIFWTRVNGFDYALYAAVQREAERFCVTALAEWISKQRYLQSITIRQHIDEEEVRLCLRSSAGRYFDNATKQYMPGEFQGKKANSPVYKRIEVHTTSFNAPVSALVVNHLHGQWSTLLR